MDFVFSIITTICIGLIGMLAVFVVTGLNGMFSVCTASFMLVGAYVSGMLSVKFGLPMPVGMVAGVAAGTLLSFIVGFPTVKLRMSFIALVTFGFGESIVAVINNLTSLTGGALGLSGVSKETTPLIAVISLIAIIYIVYTFSKSKYGRQSIAIKNNPLAAAAMGINVNRVRLISFLLGGAISSFAGVLYVHNTTFIEPAGFGWLKTAAWIIMVFVGGLNSLSGAIFAGIVLLGLPEILRFAGEWRIVIYSVIVLFVVNFRPQGLFGRHEFSIVKTVRWIKRKLGTKTKTSNIQ